MDVSRRRNQHVQGLVNRINSSGIYESDTTLFYFKGNIVLNMERPLALEQKKRNQKNDHKTIFDKKKS
jgi:hypothetical protein